MLASNNEIIIGHTADSHIDEMTGPEESGRNLRLEDTKRCLNEILSGFRKNKVDLIVHAGDLFDKAKLWSDRTLQNLQVSIDFLRNCAEIAPTVVILGTENHDNPQAFEVLKQLAIPNLHIITEPDVKFLNTKKGFVQVAGFPVFDPRNFLLEDFENEEFERQFESMPIAEKNAILSRGLAAGVASLDRQLNLAHPSILVLHHEIQGCERENGSSSLSSRKNDVIMPLAELVNTNFNLVCAGHIHKAQRIPALKPIYYSGPPTGIGFGEEGQAKGFYVHRINLESKMVNSEFVETSYRRFFTLSLNNEDIALWNKGELLQDIWADNVRDAIVRVQYSCSDSENKLFNKRQFEQYLYSQGAFFVHSITPENIAISTAKQTMNENDGILENIKSWLDDYFETLDLATRPCCTEQEEIINNIITLAQPIIAMAGAKSPSGKLSGVFSLKSLRVANYRMHRDSQVDFSKINFAIINGKNGTGKSSFFSDALVDGFFEDSRGGKESEVGSWITNGQWDGLIEIVFELNSTWKVIRQRSRRGQGSVKLSLEEWTGEKWENRSGANKTETQSKIEALLGMDVDTFRCIASIQQNRYDEFFRADRKDRMRILCAILGIGVYETIADIARDRRKDINREINALKEKVEVLSAALAGRDVAGVELANVKTELERLNGELVEKESEYQQVIQAINALSLEIQRGNEVQKQINELNREIGEKRDLTGKQNELIQRANTLLENREKIEIGAAECERLKIEKAGLEAKKPQLEGLRQQEKQLNDELQQQLAAVVRANQILDKKESIIQWATEYERLKEQKTILETKGPQLNGLSQQKDQLAEQCESLTIESGKINEKIVALNAMLKDKDVILNNAALYNEVSLACEKMAEKAELAGVKQELYRETEGKLAIEKGRIQSEKEKLELSLIEARQKSALLNDSGCIDPEKASCRFLADAQIAKESIEGLIAKIETISKSETKEALIKELEQLKTEIDAIGFDSTVFEQLKIRLAELAPFVQSAAQIEAREQLLSGLTGQSLDIQNRLLTAKTSLETTTRAWEDLLVELEPLNGINSKITELEPCARLKDQIPAAQESLKNAQVQVETVNAALENTVKTIAELNAELNPLASIDSKIIELGNCTRLKEQIPAAEQAVLSAQEQIKFLETEIADKQSRADLLSLELPQTDKQNELVTANNTKSTMELTLNSLRQNINAKSITQGRLESQIEAFQKQEVELAEAQQKLAALTETWNSYNLLIKACGFDGVPLAIIRNVIPELTAKANYILGQMSRGTMSLDILLDKEQANGKEVPCLDVMVNEIYSGSLSFAERSGGEKVRAGLAFAFALSDIKARRIGIQVAFMSVDEPPFLDEEGTEAYCDALEWLNGEFTGMQVVAISHDPRMKARFRQEIVCWKDDSGSHLKVAA